MCGGAHLHKQGETAGGLEHHAPGDREGNLLDAVINKVLENLIPLAVITVGGLVARQMLPPVKAWIDTASTWLQTHIDHNTLQDINTIVMDVVASAEAARIKHDLEGNAFDALKWALGEADVRLNEMGIDIDADRLFHLLRGALLTYLASQGVDLTLPAEADTIQRDVVPAVGERYIEVTPNPTSIAAKQALAARLWA